MEQFYTLQGEGAHTGTAAYFIRLAGCDVGCVWCDVKESWQAGGHPQRALADIIAEAEVNPSRVAVVTGGEPAMYDLDELTSELNQKGFRTHIETSGVHKLTGEWHWICLSPKKFKPAAEGIHQRAHELKVIVYHKSDFAFAEEHAAKVGADCQLYLQPEWGRVNQMLPQIVNFVKDNPRWKVSLQTHKYMNIP